MYKSFPEYLIKGLGVFTFCDIVKLNFRLRVFCNNTANINAILINFVLWRKYCMDKGTKQFLDMVSDSNPLHLTASRRRIDA